MCSFLLAVGVFWKKDKQGHIVFSRVFEWNGELYNMFLYFFLGGVKPKLILERNHDSFLRLSMQHSGGFGLGYLKTYVFSEVIRSQWRCQSASITTSRNSGLLGAIQYHVLPGEETNLWVSEELWGSSLVFYIVFCVLWFSTVFLR